MALPVEINPLQLKTSGGYSVSKSLRFRSSASANLSRTFSAAPTTRTKQTISTWVKRGSLGSIQDFFAGYDGSSTNSTDIQFAANDTLIFEFGGSSTFQVGTTQVFRDPSAWYHIVASIDTTQATAANRVILYVNGAQVTSYALTSYPAQNAVSQLTLNNANNRVGSQWNSSSFFDGYLAEFYFIDGQALTPTSFGTYDANGVWQPIKYSGSFGTNGFYLNFGNTTSTTTLGYDTSGNSNNWTTNNISLTAGTTYDSMTDSPTVSSASVANYAVVNPLLISALTYSNGNLTITNSTASWYNARTTMPFPSTGKFYYEQICTSGVNCWAGIGNSNTFLTGNPAGYDANSYGYQNDGQKITNSSASAYGTSYTTNDVIGVAFDAATGSVWFSKNGTWQNSGVPASGTGYAFTGITGTIYPIFSSSGSGATVVQSYNFGQRPFTYTPPSGFVALNTYNLPTPTIANGAKYMAATLYTGNGSTQTITNGGNNTIGTTFQPDLVWAKRRDAVGNNSLQNSVQGSTVQLSSNSTAAAITDATEVTSFNSNGFSVGNSSGSGYGVNISTGTYIGWQWKANGTGVSNTDGSITSTVSANTTSGFSIVTYTATGANATVGHGLGVAPAMYIVKNYASGTTNWPVYHISTTAAGNTYLNATNAYAASATMWNSTAPTSTVFSVGSNPNFVSGTTIAYCWSAVPGYSAFGSYTGNGSTDGPFVYTGFRPRFLLVKRTDTVESWNIVDTSRDTYNQAGTNLYPNLTNAESNNNLCDLLSNGFKLRNTWTGSNTSGGTYIYAAFAENPFNSSRAR